MKIQEISNNELLNLVAKILSQPGKVTAQDAIDLREINDEFVRRDRAFFAAILTQGKSAIKGTQNGN